MAAALVSMMNALSASGLKRQDNDLVIVESADALAAVRRDFDAQFAKGETLPARGQQ